MGRSTEALLKTVFGAHLGAVLCKRVPTVLHQWLVDEILAADGKESYILAGTVGAVPVLPEGISAVEAHLDRYCMV